MRDPRIDIRVRDRRSRRRSAVPSPEPADEDAGPAARVLIADAYAPYRLGIRMALEAGGFEIAGEAATGLDAVAVAVSERPEACLLDVALPGGGLVTAREIAAAVPGAAVVMLSASLLEEDVLAAIRAGASGYLLKAMDVQRLPVVLRCVLDGEPAIPRVLVGRLIAEVRQQPRPPALRFAGGQAVRLTPRELQVLDLMRHDMPTRDIAARLGISAVTVRRHASTAARKLKAPDRTAAARLLEPDPAAKSTRR